MDTIVAHALLRKSIVIYGTLRNVSTSILLEFDKIIADRMAPSCLLSPSVTVQRSSLLALQSIVN